MNCISYQIRAAVTSDGSPEWALIKIVAIPFFSFYAEYPMARNSDRSVLEQAMKHLRSSEPQRGDSNG